MVYQSALVESELTPQEPISVDSQLIEEQTSWLDRIMTPWGIFGILIFLASNLLIFINLDSQQPAQIAQNNLNNQKQSPIPNNNPNNQINLANPPTPQPTPTKNNNNPPSPTQIETQSTPEVANLPLKSPYPNLQTALLSEINNQQPPSSVAPQPEAIPEPPKSVANNSPATSAPENNQVSKKETKYYVLSDYQNMKEFARIQKLVPSAFITNVNQKMKIQLGVFDDQKKAQQKSQQLKNQGIKNYLYNSSDAEPGT